MPLGAPSNSCPKPTFPEATFPVECPALCWWEVETAMGERVQSLAACVSHWPGSLASPFSQSAWTEGWVRTWLRKLSLVIDPFLWEQSMRWKG